MIRPARPSDTSFIKSSFFESSRDSAVAHSVSPALYRRKWTALVDKLVERYQATVFADEENPEVILGWALHDGDHLVVYVFVREDFRRQGVARALLASIPHAKVYAFRTTSWQRVSARLAPLMTYDPTVAWQLFADAPPRTLKGDPAWPPSP